MSEEKRKHVCKFHPQRDSFVVVIIDYEDVPVCRACYDRILRERAVKYPRLKKGFRK